MDEPPFVVATCAECGRFAEPPLTPLYNLFGTRTGWVVCQDCFGALIHPRTDPPTADETHDLGGEGG